ncbi:MAG TPA: PAS domain-containing protein, partial [Thermoanaerobaculia bacterium]|nr:PAS domain-containing protein [Thermoanaerobaculia bacterium]
MRALLLKDDAVQRSPMETEEALRFTQFLLDRAGEGAFGVDPEGRFFYANEAGCAMMGYTREEMLSLRVLDVLCPEVHAAIMKILEKARANGPFT